MLEFLKKHFRTLQEYGKECVVFNAVHKEMDDEKISYIITVAIDDFIKMFNDPIQKAINNGTDLMEEIRAFDPENKLGYNTLIV